MRKGIKCLFCDEHQVVQNTEKDWFLCLSCGLDYELDKTKENKNA
jgi:transcription elongation factor Elf1